MADDHLMELAAKYVAITEPYTCSTGVGWNPPDDETKRTAAAVFRELRSQIDLGESLILLDQAREIFRMVYPNVPQS